MPILSHHEIHRIWQAAVAADLAPARMALRVSIDGTFVAGLPLGGDAASGLLLDLEAMNRAGQLANGSVPLAIWLDTAILLAGDRVQASELRQARAVVRGVFGPRSTRSPAEVTSAPIVVSTRAGAMAAPPRGRGVVRRILGLASAVVAVSVWFAVSPLLLGGATRAPAGRDARPAGSDGPDAPAVQGAQSSLRAAPAPRPIEGIALCDDWGCTLWLDRGTFEEPVQACIDARAEGVDVTCTVSGDPQGASSVVCVRSDAAWRVPVKGAFRWRRCEL
ncbi:MAG: hypothetical protein QM820_31205 [Minicystis sp.]